MPLSSREAFKVGFLARCAVLGLSHEETMAAVKQASEKNALLGLEAIPGKFLDMARSLGSTALGWGIPLALAAPPMVGGLAGYGLAKATDISDKDVEDVKNQEVMDEYKKQTARLRRQRAIRDYYAARKQTGRIFL